MKKIQVCCLVIVMALAVALALFLRPAPARADACTWDGSTGDWSGGTHWDCGHAPGSGDTAIINTGSSYVSVTTDTSVGSLNLSIGALGGSGKLTVLGTMNWSGGWMVNSGVTEIAPGAGLNISNGNLDSRTLNNVGTINWTSGSLSLFNSATINNQVGGVLDIQGGASLGVGSGSNVLNNHGTLMHTGAGTTDLGALFNSDGVVQVPAGTLNLSAGGTGSGTWTVALGAVLGFTGGTHTITLGPADGMTGQGSVVFRYSATTIGGSGTYNVTSNAIDHCGADLNLDATMTDLYLSFGSLGGSGTVTLLGTVTWSPGGGMVGSGVTNIAPTAVVNLTGGILDGRTLNNAGTVNWTSGDLTMRNGATLNNQAGGTFNAQVNDTVGNGEGSNTFNNEGTFTRSGAGTTRIQTPFINGSALKAGGGHLANGGATVNVSSGALTFGNQVTNNGWVILANGASLMVDDTLTNNGALKQTLTVGTGNTVFLNISTAKYYGVEIDPAGGEGMGDTAVTVWGNQLCPGATQGVKRCYEIDPGTERAADVKLYFAEGERNDETLADLKVWHWTGSIWSAEGGTTTTGGSGAAQWVRVTGVLSYSPFALSSANPALVWRRVFLPVVMKGYSLDIGVREYRNE